MSTQTTRCLGPLGRQALSGRAGGQRSALRRAQRAALRVLLPTLLLTVSLAGCAPFPPPSPPRPTTTPVDCATTFKCRVVVPRCGPAVMSAQGTNGLWYYGKAMPHNTPDLLGFQPRLPMSIPQGASWYTMSLWDLGDLGPQHGHPLLLHASYGHWPPREDSSLRGQDSRAVLTLEETTGILDPLAYLTGINQGLRIQSQRATTVGGQQATVYHLADISGAGNSIQAIEVTWHAGPVTLRVVGSPSLGISDFDTVEPWEGVAGADQTGDDDGVLLRLAASVVPYTDCG